jgi:hypothetical protein
VITETCGVCIEINGIWFDMQSTPENQSNKGMTKKLVVGCDVQVGALGRHTAAAAI